MGDGMTAVVFDIERCFTDGRSGPIELGVTRLDDLARAHPPAIDGRATDRSQGSPYVAYGDNGGLLHAYDTDGSGAVTTISINLRGADVLRKRMNFPIRETYELECEPFLIRMSDREVEHWATLVDALWTEAIEPNRPVELSTDIDCDARILNFDWRLPCGRQLHLPFEPRLVENRNVHPCQVRFEYCIERVRLFATSTVPDPAVMRKHKYKRELVSSIELRRFQDI